MRIVTRIHLQCSGSKTWVSFNQIRCVIKIISTCSFQEVPNRYLTGHFLLVTKLKVQTRSSPEGQPYLLEKSLMLYLHVYVLFSTSWHYDLPSTAFGRKEMNSCSCYKCMALYFKGQTDIRLACYISKGKVKYV